MEKSLGEIAYEEYGATTNYKNFLGNPMPEWDALTGIIHQAWENTALKIWSLSNPPLISEKLAWRNQLDERQQKALFNAEEYAKDPFGDNGHNLKVLVAKLAELLDTKE